MKTLIIVLVAVSVVSCAPRPKSVWLDPVVIDIRDSMVRVEKIEYSRQGETNRASFYDVERVAGDACALYNKPAISVSQSPVFGNVPQFVPFAGTVMVRVQIATHYLFSCADRE